MHEGIFTLVGVIFGSGLMLLSNYIFDKKKRNFEILNEKNRTCSEIWDYSFLIRQNIQSLLFNRLEFSYHDAMFKLDGKEVDKEMMIIYHKTYRYYKDQFYNNQKSLFHALNDFMFYFGEKEIVKNFKKESEQLKIEIEEVNKYPNLNKSELNNSHKQLRNTLRDQTRSKYYPLYTKLEDDIEGFQNKLKL